MPLAWSGLLTSYGYHKRLYKPDQELSIDYRWNSKKLIH